MVTASSLFADTASAKIASRIIVADSSIHQPLGDKGPQGQPAGSRCQWSRMQIPTVMGLRWVAEEDCPGDGN